MVSKIVLALCLMVTVAAAVPAAVGAGGWPGAGAGAWPASNPWGWPGADAGVWPAAGAANPWIPPWVSAAPWFPVWSPCATIGNTCLDCNTKAVCTKIGQIKLACADPLRPYCNLGECSATPTTECAPATAVPTKV